MLLLIWELLCLYFWDFLERYIVTMQIPVIMESVK